MISPIIKICLTAHLKDKQAIINFLQESSMVEVENWQVKDKSSQEIETEVEYSLAQVKFTLDFLASYQKEKPSLAEKLAGSKIALSNHKLQEIVDKFDWPAVVTRVEDLEAALSQEWNKINKLTAAEEILKPWQNLNFTPHQLNQLKKIKGVLGIISFTHWEKFNQELKKISNLIEVVEVENKGKEKYIAVIYQAKEEIESQIKRIISEQDFKIVDLPQPENLPIRSLKQIDQEKEQAQENIKKIERDIKNYLKNEKKLKIIFDWLTWQEEQKKAINMSKLTQQTFALLLWVEEDNLCFLEDGLGKITKDYDLTKVPIGQRESIPVMIRNREVIKPFEQVTSIYGMPAAKELDPTPLLAPFFIIFFALCLTDAGYGILLAVISWLAIKLMKIPKAGQGMFRLLIYGGIVTFFTGALTGGWFGINIEALPETFTGLKNLLLKFRIIDPVKNPLKMLGVALVMGIIQVMAGIVIKMYWQIKKRKILDAILDSGLWLYFIASILFFGLIKSGSLPMSLASLAKYLLLVGVVALILTQGRKKKNPLLKFASGVISLYSLVGYLSDVLSYSRLLALGLATGIIAMVINLIAVLFKDMIPYVGWLVMVVILVGGHIFNLAINTLGAFIHSGRLQFVEFFPKFMAGGGRRFKPFSKETKYIKLV